MATYYASRVSTSNTALAGDFPARYSEQLVSQFAEFTVGVSLSTDTIQLFNVPAGATILDLYISSGGTQGANSDSVFTVGDGSSTARFITTAGGLCLRSGGGISRMNAHAGTGYVYTAADTIDLLVTTAGTGQTTTGVIRAMVLYAPNR
jgi:hypothetical protein